MESITKIVEENRTKRGANDLYQIIIGKDVNKYVYFEAKKLINNRLNNIEDYIPNLTLTEMRIKNPIFTPTDYTNILKEYFKIKKFNWFKQQYIIWFCNNNDICRYISDYDPDYINYKLSSYFDSNYSNYGTISNTSLIIQK